ncbi:MAG: sterol desaturase family protein [Bacteroidota bacterium]
MTIWDTFFNAYSGYAGYLWREITFQVSPWYHNYFFWLLLVSGFFFLLEGMAPWRTGQARFRKDFWLDFFYMFFNFFLFSLLIFHAASNVIVDLFQQFLAWFGITNLLALEVQSWPLWGHLLLGFVVRDFVQWWIHRLLHRSEFLWEFHKVHHSVEQMGFAAHLRYHWMENVVYKSLEYLPLAMIGIGLNDFFIIHIFTLVVGHYNHSNISIPSQVTGSVLAILVSLIFISELSLTSWNVFGILFLAFVLGRYLLGPVMKYLFNSPEMHIWHHAYNLPEDHRHGVNFGLTLSLWDWLFGTAYIPHNGRDIRLGFPGVEQYPKSFTDQLLHGFRKNRKV